MLSLGLVGCIHDSFIDPVVLADYLLFLLNLQDSLGKLYGDYMLHPTNDIYELMYHICKQRNTLKQDGSYDELGAATHWINLWKQGKTKKYRALFDLEAIREASELNIRDILNLERERVGLSKVHERIVCSFGDDGSSSTTHRKGQLKIGKLTCETDYSNYKVLTRIHPAKISSISKYSSNSSLFSMPKTVSVFRFLRLGFD